MTFDEIVVEVPLTVDMLTHVVNAMNGYKDGNMLSNKLYHTTLRLIDDARQELIRYKESDSNATNLKYLDDKSKFINYNGRIGTRYKTIEGKLVKVDSNGTPVNKINLSKEL